MSPARKVPEMETRAMRRIMRPIMRVILLSRAHRHTRQLGRPPRQQQSNASNDTQCVTTSLSRLQRTKTGSHTAESKIYGFYVLLQSHSLLRTISNRKNPSDQGVHSYRERLKNEQDLWFSIRSTHKDLHHLFTRTATDIQPRETISQCELNPRQGYKTPSQNGF